MYNKERVLSDQKISIADVKLSNLKEKTSTQEAFGHLLYELGKGTDASLNRIITTSPDVTVSTNLGGWVNQRNIFRIRVYVS